jgi:hypothetical protein
VPLLIIDLGMRKLPAPRPKTSSNWFDAPLRARIDDHHRESLARGLAQGYFGDTPAVTAFLESLDAPRPLA